MDVKAAAQNPMKMTEIGEIPEDWDASPISILCEMKSGRTITAASIESSGNYPCYGGNGLRGYTSDFTHDGEFVLVGRQGALCGNVVRVTGSFFASEHSVVCTPSCTTDCTWLFYTLKSRELGQFSESSAQPGLSVDKLAKVLCITPSSSNEQKAIAEALSDADDYIRGLEKLVDKKRAIKRGAMLELLTGRRRLPGFAKSSNMKMTEIGEIPEDWDMLPLKDLAEIRSGGTPSTKDSTLWNGDVSWITPADITRLGGKKKIAETERTISEKGLKQSSAELIPVGSIILTTRATIGEAAVNSKPMATNQGFKNLVPNPKANNEFLYYLLLTKKPDMLALCAGSTFLEISKSQLAGILVQCPPQLDEQQAIAEVLSNMDDEITVLETQLDKAKQIKQAMMQELLTGRIRLI